MNLRPYQNRALDAIDSAFSKVNSALIVMATGCHARGEKVLLANGSTVSVESVKKGDTLLGADGSPRTVLALHHGVRNCYEIRPTKGSPFIVTDDHILSLERTTVRNDCFPCHKGGEIIDISVLDWISSSKTFQHQHKLYRSKLIEFPTPHEKLPIPSYILGVLLGDGGIKTSIDVTTAEPEVLSELKEYAAKNGYTLRYEPAGLAKRWIFQTHTQGCRGSVLHNHLKNLGLRRHESGEKFIPLCYKTASSHDRLELLAGLIDTDGSKSSNSSCDYITKSRQLAEDIAFICRSLGLAAYHHQCVKNIKSIGFSGLYWRVSISGDLSIIPTRVARRKFEQRKQKKSVLRTGFTAIPIGKREYFGFTVDGDNRYLLDDFTVTHNCGKTIVMSALADREIRRGGRVLILAHRAELINQAVDKLQRATGIAAGIEMADLCSDTDIETPPYMVIVGSVQSMCRPARLARFHPDDFTLVMIDECHHALAETYRSVVRYFSSAKLLGVTATPDRGDLRSLGEVFEKIAFEYSIVEAIKDGYLSPVRAQTIPLKIDISGVAKQAGDYQASGLGSALAPYLHQICVEILQRAADRKTVVFTPLIATSRLMLDKFAELGATDRVREVNGESKDRKEILEWFDNAPKGSIILNSMLLTEGWDSPSADCICVLRATRSRGLYVQMVGRGTRLCEGKENLLLLDFLWLTQSHDLCRPAVLLSNDDEVCEMITKKQEKKAGVEDIELTPETLEEAESDTVKKRHDALAKKLEEQRRKKGNLVDPLQYAYSISDINLTNYTPLTDRDAASPTMEQINRLEQLGFGCPDSFGAAELLVKTAEERHAKGMAAPKEIRLLERRHFKNVAQWTHEQASKMIRRLVANGWRTPYGINPETYKPE